LHEFGLAPVQFKSEISGVFARKRHQKRQLEFCQALLISRGSGFESLRARHFFLLPIINPFPRNPSDRF